MNKTYFQQAIDLKNRKKYNESLKLLTSLLQNQDSQTPKVYYEIAKIYEAQENYKKAIEYYTAHLNIFYINDLLYDRALCYIKLDNTQLAIEDLEKYLCNTNNALAYNYLGYLYNKTNNLDKAIIYLNKSIEIDGLFLDPYELLFDILLKTNKSTIAIETLNKAISKTSDLAKKQLLVKKIAEVYFDLEMYEKAKTLYIQLLQTDQNNMDFLYKISYCLIQLGDFESASKNLKYALQINNQDYNILETIGFYLYNIKFSYDNALKYYTRALTTNPANIDAIINVASCYKKLGMQEDSFKFYNEAYAKTTERLKTEKDNCYLYILYANILLGLDNFEESVRFFQKSIDVCNINKQYYLSYFGMAKAYESILDYENALYFINKSISLSQNIVLKYFHANLTQQLKKASTS